MQQKTFLKDVDHTLIGAIFCLWRCRVDVSARDGRALEYSKALSNLRGLDALEVLQKVKV